LHGPRLPSPARGSASTLAQPPYHDLLHSIYVLRDAILVCLGSTCIVRGSDAGRYGPVAQVAEDYLVTEPGAGFISDCSWQNTLQNIQLSIMLLASEALLVSVSDRFVVNCQLTGCLADLEDVRDLRSVLVVNSTSHRTLSWRSWYVPIMPSRRWSLTDIYHPCSALLISSNLTCVSTIYGGRLVINGQEQQAVATWVVTAVLNVISTVRWFLQIALLHALRLYHSDDDSNEASPSSASHEYGFADRDTRSSPPGLVCVCGWHPCRVFDLLHNLLHCDGCLVYPWI
jgi:hypothetical protein